MRCTDGQCYEEGLEKTVLLRINKALPRCLATFCMENISRGRQRRDRVEMKREIELFTISISFYLPSIRSLVFLSLQTLRRTII